MPPLRFRFSSAAFYYGRIVLGFSPLSLSSFFFLPTDLFFQDAGHAAEMLATSGFSAFASFLSSGFCFLLSVGSEVVRHNMYYGWAKG